MGLYTVLNPCLKGENTNRTKNDLKFKIFSGEISLNNMRNDLAVKSAELAGLPTTRVILAWRTIK